MNTSSDTAPYQVRTHNPSTQSENRMHSDDVARQFGFKGGLVPGVTVFSHMTQPMVARHGEAWLTRGTADVSFGKPAYEGELLSIHTNATGSDTYALTCANEQGIELARMSATLPSATATCTPADARGDIPAAPPLDERPTVTWELMEIGKPFPALAWTPTRDENLEWCDDSRDGLALYRDGATPLLHPGFILRQANYVLRKRFIIPAWIHAASRITFFLKRCVSAPATKCAPFPKKNGSTKATNLCACMWRCAARITAGAPWRRYCTPRFSGHAFVKTFTLKTNPLS